MNKAILISIHPEWCEKIASGNKTIEVRKTKPKLDTPFKCYIYCTNDKRLDLVINNQHGYIFGKIAKKVKETMSISYIANSSIIGEFTCSHIEMIRKNPEIALPLSFTEIPYTDFFAKSQLTEIELLDYLDDHDGYGWHISDLVIYDKPRELSEFYCHKPLVRPPQSWCYVEEI